METEQDLDHQLHQFFYLSWIGLPKLKVVESTVSEIMGWGASAQIPPPPPSFVEGVGTKYFRTGRVQDCYSSCVYVS